MNRNPGAHQSYLVALGAPGPAVLSAWMSGVVVERKIWDAAAGTKLDGGRPIGFLGRGAICVVFLLQGNVTEKSSSLHVHVFCICATDLSFLAECLAIPNELVVWFSPSLQPFFRSRVNSYSRIYRRWL